MRAYSHTITRCIKHNIAKLLSILFIVFIGIAFVSGIGTLSSVMRNSFSEYYTENNAPDLVIKNTSGSDLSDEDEDGEFDIIEDLLSSDLVDGVTTVTAIDSSAIELMEESIYDEMNSMIPSFLPIDYELTIPEILPEDFPLTRLSTIHADQTIDTISIVEGRLPENEDEIAIEQTEGQDMIEYSLGDTIDLGDGLGGTKTIVGILANPLIVSKYGEPDLINQENLQQIIYLYGDSITVDLTIDLTIELLGREFSFSIPYSYDVPVSDIYVDIDTDGRSYFSSSYENYVDDCVDELSSTVLSSYSSSITILTMEQNTSYAYLKEYCSKVDVIAAIFPVFFIAVAALVVASTMSRMVEEERAMIGCLSTLGYSDGQIIKKYALLSFTCCLIGCLLGIIFGLFLIPTIIYPCLYSTFYAPPMSYLLSPTYGLVSSLLMMIIITLISALSCRKTLKEEPATLLLPKAPKAGKKIWLEHIRPLWRHLPFRIKSAFRNIFRYKKNLVMTIVSVAGSTVLVFAGLGLLDVGNSLADNPLLSGLQDTLVPIAVLIICFAVILCSVVIYNLTNMNIGERAREIATLKVLGYRESEVHMYVYREIMIMTIIGVIIGLPIGVLLMYLVLNSLNLGSLGDIQVYTYFVTIAIVLVLVVIVDCMLIPKINKIDMSTSLKSVD